MCSHYEAPETERLIAGYGVAPEGQFKIDLWPCYEGPFIRLRNDESAEEEVPELEAVVGQFGLLPFWGIRNFWLIKCQRCKEENLSQRII